MTHGTLICVWGLAVQLKDRDLTLADSILVKADLTDPLAALRVAFDGHSGPVALVDGRYPPPEGWLARLAAGLELDPDADVVSALDSANPLLTPWQPGTDVPDSPATADALCRLYADRLFFPQRAVSSALSLWRGAPADLDGYDAFEDLADSNLRILTCDHVLAGPGDQARPENGPLDLLRYRLGRADAAGSFDLALARPDEPATVLHITHSWGGGTQRWISDLIEGLDDRRHLILMSRGDSDGLDCGQLLELHVGSTNSPPVRAWPLPASIRSVEISCREHAAVVETVIRDWGVGQVIVSSVIGHSLAVLRTGLPTLVVCHDYFPHWPNLDVTFEADQSPFDLARLEHMGSERRWFKDLSPARWQAVRDAYLADLEQANVRLAAPSQSVLSNLARLAPALGDRAIALIPHAHRNFSDSRPVAGSKDRDRWRIVVPGRIAPGKGKALVRELSTRFGEQAQFYLVGAGNDGHDFFGLNNVHIVLEYERDDLPALLRAIAPDFALLASTVSETFSYTLSEMWAMGLPVIATRRGAFIERITDGVNGALFEPTAESFGAVLDALDRETLQRWQQQLANAPLESIESMAAAYGQLLPRPEARVVPTHLVEPRFFSSFMLAGDDLKLRGELDRAGQRIVAQQAELDRRGSWGFRISQELEARTLWAQSLDGELELARRRLDRRTRELADRTNWANKLDGELESARNHLESRTQELADRTTWAKKLDGELEATRTHLAQRTEELDDRTRWALQLHARNDRLERQLTVVHRELDERTAWAIDLGKQLEATQKAFRELDARFTLQIDQANLDIADLGRRLEDMTAARAAAQRDHAELSDRYQEVITSRSWFLTKPLRFAARATRRVLDVLLLRGRRTASLASRTRRSLEVRGVKGTVDRIEKELRKPKPAPTAVAAPDLARDRKPLVFPEVDAPKVSVVIPVHNHYAHTYGCLKSLLATHNETSFEVVVVDDASSDETIEELPRIKGIRHLRNGENLGFVGTCNRGAEASSGEFLVFLNNDTAVAEGWIDALLETFSTFPDAGLVGAKLVYPDGRLQEAGGIVFADGSGWNYGRFEDPDHPSFNFVREVDYCSGAAIAIRRDLFETLGRFDQRYAPAYYEDTDLAFAVRAHGLKVYYQPAATVTHFEGITSGTDTASGTKRYQVINQQKFREKWASELATQPKPGTPIQRAREHGRPQRALIIDACTPEPDKDSGSVRMVHIMQILKDLGYQVSFFADNRAWVDGYTPALTGLGVEAWYHPWLDHSPRFFEQAENTYDVVILSRYYVASNYIDQLRRHCPGARLLFDTVDLHFLREQRMAELEADARLAATALQTREKELGVAAACDATLVVSPFEQSFLAEEAPGVDVAVVSNIHHVHGRRQGWADRRNIMFVGGYQHPPNIDAVQWFATEIFPMVREELTDVTFHIVGSKATPAVQRLGALDGIEFHGFVEDIEPFFDGCRIAVAPLRYGAGVKGKVNSSMSYGQPVVATTPAVEGMFVKPGEDVLVADTPEEFAAQVVRAYRDKALWNRLSDGGLENVQRYFSFDAARDAIREAIRPHD